MSDMREAFDKLFGLAKKREVELSLRGQRITKATMIQAEAIRVMTYMIPDVLDILKQKGKYKDEQSFIGEGKTKFRVFTFPERKIPYVAKGYRKRKYEEIGKQHLKTIYSEAYPKEDWDWMFDGYQTFTLGEGQDRVRLYVGDIYFGQYNIKDIDKERTLYPRLDRSTYKIDYGWYLDDSYEEIKKAVYAKLDEWAKYYETTYDFKKRTLYDQLIKVGLGAAAIASGIE